MSQPSPRPNRITRWVVAALAAVFTLAPLNAASAETTPITADESQLVAVAVGTTEAETRGPGIMHTGDELRLSLSFDNRRTDAFAAATAVVEIGLPLPGRTAVVAWHDRTTPATALEPLATLTTPALPAASTTQWDLTVPTTSTATLAPGTYPIRVTLQSTNGATLGIARTTLTVGTTPITQQPHSLIVVPVVAPSVSSGVLTPAELADFTAPTGQLTAIAEAVSTTATSVALAIDPAISAAITLRGSEVATAASWFETLETSGADRFALQFADADIAGQAAAGVETPIVPTSLAGFVPGMGSGAEDAPTGMAYFDTAGLLSITNATPGIFWPRADASAEELATIAGYAEGAVSLVASEALAEPITSVSAVIADAAQALVIDSELSRVATLAATASNDVVRAGALAQLSAMLTGTAAEDSVVLALDRAVFETGARSVGTLLGAEDTPAHNQTRTPNTADLEAVFATLSGHSRVTSLAELISHEPVPAAVTPASNEARTFAVTTVFAQSSAIADLASAIEQPELLTGTEQARALQVLATARFTTDTELAEALAEHTDHVNDILGAVTLDAPPSVQQISRSIELPITVRNSLPYAVNVHVKTTPEDIKLDVDRDVSAVAMPHTSTVVKVPVEARVTSAKTSITLALQSPNGTPLGAQVKVPVSVHAQWESVGIGIIGTLIAALLSIGTVRTIRKSRRGAKPADADETEPVETE